MSDKLEELKSEIDGVIDKAWHLLEGTVDVEAARSMVQEVTAALGAKVADVGEHLFFHVLNNSTGDAPAAPVTETPGLATSAPEGSVEVPAEPVTGMAPAAGEPVAETTEAPAADATGEATATA